MIDITWTISQLEYTNDPDKAVLIAHWRCIASETPEGEEKVSTSVYGSCSFQPDPSSPDYIPYEDLTEDDVLNWVYALIDKDATELTATEKLKGILNPTVLDGVPWEQAP